MEKILAGRNNCDILDSVFLQNENMTGVCAFKKPLHPKGLTSFINQFTLTGAGLTLNDELSDTQVYNLALKLACAIDKNSTQEIRTLKQQYANTIEFSKAKDYLNRCCKQVWDVFDKNYNSSKVPLDAMKTLGITNKPSLDFLLENSLKYYEKDGGTTSVDIITNILNNKNSGYTFEDIYKYLKVNRTKFQLNQLTVSYLARQLDYNCEKLESIGILHQQYKKIRRINLQFFKKACKKIFVWL